MTSSFCIATNRRPHAMPVYGTSTMCCPDSLNVDQALSIVAYDGKQCVNGTVLAWVFLSLASAHEISFLYLGTVEPRNWDKVRG